MYSSFYFAFQSTDSELLGEMMFGSMPMKVIGNTVKVHYIRSAIQLSIHHSNMLSVVEQVSVHRSISKY